MYLSLGSMNLVGVEGWHRGVGSHYAQDLVLALHSGISLGRIQERTVHFFWFVLLWGYTHEYPMHRPHS